MEEVYSAAPQKEPNRPLNHVQTLQNATSVHLLWLHFTLTPALWMRSSSLLRKQKTREVRQVGQRHTTS